MMEELLLRHLQFSSGSSAGGVFLGDTGTDSDVPFPGNTTDSDGADTAGSSDDDDGFPVYATAVFYLAGLLVGVILIALLTWSLAYIMDYCCCCFPWFHSLDFNRAMVWDQSGLAKRARLFGLTLPERRKILQDYVFEESILYSTTGTGTAKTSSKSDTTTVVSSLGEDSSPDNNDNAGDIESGMATDLQESPTEQQQEEEEVHDPLDDADHERLCCICLAEYQDGDRLLRGKSCRHQFHYQCSMDWLMKPHDNCPYCRQYLVPVSTFRQGAIQCLGIKRVEAMSGPGMVEMTVSPTTTTAPTLVVIEAADPLATTPTAEHSTDNVEAPSPTTTAATATDDVPSEPTTTTENVSNETKSDTEIVQNNTTPLEEKGVADDGDAESGTIEKANFAVVTAADHTET